MLQLLVLTAVSFLVTLFILPFIIKMIFKASFLRLNFKNEHIPVGVGLVFFIALTLTAIFSTIFSFLEQTTMLLILFASSSMTILGLVDDLMGSAEARGLKGHFKKLFLEKELTTGALKALMGGVIAFLVSIIILPPQLSFSWVLLLILNTLIIALFTNLINLMDLRPGRAGKVFLIISGLLIIFGYSSPQIGILGLILGSLLAYLPKDLAAQTMMGDTGSNVLGVTLGIASVLVLETSAKLIVLGLLVLMHIITEKYSLTKIIEKNKILRYFDMLGRE